MGSPAMNFVVGTVQDGTIKGNEGSFNIKPDAELVQKLGNYNGKRVSLGVRPEDLGVRGQTDIQDTGDNHIRATVEVVEPLGAETIVISSVEGDQSVVARIEPFVAVKPGDQIELVANTSKVQAFAIDGDELNIRYS